MFHICLSHFSDSRIIKLLHMTYLSYTRVFFPLVHTRYVCTCALIIFILCSLLPSYFVCGEFVVVSCNIQYNGMSSLIEQIHTLIFLFHSKLKLLRPWRTEYLVITYRFCFIALLLVVIYLPWPIHKIFSEILSTKLSILVLTCEDVWSLVGFNVASSAKLASHEITISKTNI